jgi:phosphoglycerate kinase
MNLKTLDQADLSSKKILLRADLNVPIKDGQITDTTRIEGIKNTVKHIQNQGGLLAICAHLGRPKGERNSKYSLSQITETLSEILENKVVFIGDCIHPEISNQLSTDHILLLENTRFHKGEKENDPEFSKQLAAPFDIFINDGFGIAHRAHASTEGVTHHLPSYAGLLMQNEIETMSPLLSDCQKPLTVLIGGAKIDTKIGIIKNFIGKADNILIGGALANTFLLAEGYNVGKSLVEEDKVEIAQEIMMQAENNGTNLLIPADVILADEIKPDAQTIDLPPEDITSNMMILDIGKNTISDYQTIIKASQTVIANGPMGLYEHKPFSNGTISTLQAMADCPGTTVIGGGDSIDAMNKYNIDAKEFDHVSTGGGAMIEFLEGKTLPGIEPLLS